MSLVARRMRRLGQAAASGFDPSSISGLSLWLDADDASSFSFSSGSVISQWRDKSGNARHATNANSPSRSATIGGKSAVALSGVNGLTGATWTPPATSTTFLVMDSNADVQFIPISGTSGSHSLFIAHNGSASSVVSTSFTISSARVDRAASTWGTRGAVYTAINGVHLITVVGTSMNSWPRVDLNTWQSSFVADVNVGELLIYNSSLGTTDRDNVESYLRTKWGTP